MSLTLADSNRGRVSISTAESTFGTSPGGNFQILRPTSAEFNAAKETVISDELRSDRMVSTVAETGFSTTGNINFELSGGTSWTTLLEAALGGTWSTAVSVTNVAATSPANTFGATGIGTNVVVGQYVFADGFSNAANNGWHRVTASTANLITVESPLVTEVAAPANRIRGRRLRNGTTPRSFSVEQAFLDVNQFFRFSGMRVSTLSLEASAGQIVTGSFGFMGANVANGGTTFAGTPVAASTTDVLNATSNLGSIFEADGITALAAIQSFNFNLDNSLRNQMVMGSKFVGGIGYGRQTVTGSLTAYFRNAALYAKFLNHAATSLSIGFQDSASPANGIRFTFPRVFFTADTENLTGVDQDVMENIEWTAVLDPTTSCQIQIDATS